MVLLDVVIVTICTSLIVAGHGDGGPSPDGNHAPLNSSALPFDGNHTLLNSSASPLDGKDGPLNSSALPFDGNGGPAAWSSFMNAGPSAYASWTSAHSTIAPPLPTITNGSYAWGSGGPFGPNNWGPWYSGSAPPGPWTSWWGSSKSGFCPPSTWSGWTSGPWSMSTARDRLIYVKLISFQAQTLLGLRGWDVMQRRRQRAR